MKFERILGPACGAAPRLASARAVDKTGLVMFAEALPHLRRWLNIALSRPLALGEAIIAGLGLLTVGTIYCQIYCLLALQKMHGATMPFSASVHRASVDIVPAFIVFELAKRVRFRNRAARWLTLLALFAAGIALAVVWRMQLHIMASGLTPRRMAVDRIPFMALAGLGIVLFHLRRGAQSSGHGNSPDMEETEVLPPPRSIDWINAAGNYVEVHFNGRAKLLRMTLQQAKGLLPADEFVQIHRSTVVNRSRISDVDGRVRTVRLNDGATLKVGETYRNALRKRG